MCTVAPAAKQYTIPVEAALEAVRNGENTELTTRQKHTRECFVVAEEGADLARIEEEIKTMPNYFDEYDKRYTLFPRKNLTVTTAESHMVVL